jgi:uncharacterized membrane protein YdjX (TVP38/TMEM64 family)
MPLSSWHRKDYVRVFLLCLFFGVLALGYSFLHRHGFVGRHLTEAIAEWVRDAGWFGPLVVLLVFAAQTVVPVPNVLLAATTGALYGPWFGSLLVVLGWLISATVSFYAGSFFGRHWFDVHASDWFKTYAELLHNRGFATVMFMRLVQVPADVIGVLCGVTRVPYREYMWASFFGLLPGAVTFTVLGRAWREPRAWLLFGGIFLASIGLALLLKRAARLCKDRPCKRFF